jgi:hypothetical protein
VKKILFTIVLVCPMATWAQDIKPFDAKLGLWESTSTTEISGMPATPATPAMPALTEEQLAKIPPAQRATVEAMMKGRGSAGSPRSNTSKYCLTRESLNRAQYNSEKNCTTKLVSSSASNQQIHVECAAGNTRSTGEVALERVDAEHIKGSVVLKTSNTDGNGVAGRTMDIKVSLNNKWLSSDCGDVKPIGEK